MTNALLGLVAKHRAFAVELEPRDGVRCLCGAQFPVTDRGIGGAVSDYANHAIEAVLAQHGEPRDEDAALAQDRVLIERLLERADELRHRVSHARNLDAAAETMERAAARLRGAQR